MAPKRPAYQWYPADADSDEVFKLMTYEQEGIYRRLLDHQWIEGSIPADPAVIAGLLPKIPRHRFLEVWPLISGKFRPRNHDRLVNDRLESQRRELDKYIRLQKEKGRKSAETRRLHVNRGSRPVDVRLEPNGNSSSSTSSSTSTVEKGGETAPPVPVSLSANSPQPRTAAITSGHREHRNHACCGIVCLHASQFEEFMRRSRNQSDPNAYVREFFRVWDGRYESGDRKGAEIGEDGFDFWRARWAESHPSAPTPKTHAQPNPIGKRTLVPAHEPL